MPKNMYQKRKLRKEAKENQVNNGEGLHKISIGWDISTDVKPHSNHYKIRICLK